MRLKDISVEKVVVPPVWGQIVKPRLWQDGVQESGKFGDDGEEAKTFGGVQGEGGSGGGDGDRPLEAEACGRIGRGGRAKSEEELTTPLYEQIGRLQREVDWLKKALSPSGEVKRRGSDPDHAGLSVVRQCALAGLARSSDYFTPTATESAENLAPMRQKTSWACGVRSSGIGESPAG